MVIGNDLFEISTKNGHARESDTRCDMSDCTGDGGSVFCIWILICA